MTELIVSLFPLCPSVLSTCWSSYFTVCVELLDVFRMKQTKMYVCTLEEFILDDLHYLMYKMELRYCVEITLVFIQSQQWMRNVGIALRSQLTSES